MIAESLNLVGYDYFIPGNHDFNYGYPYFLSFTSQLNAHVLCANMKEGSIQPFLSYDIKTFDDINIAVIGLTNHFISIWEPEKNIPNLTFLQPIDVLKQVLKNLKQKHEVDAIIVAYHGGVENDLNFGNPLGFQTGENVGYDIFKTFEEIDILLTGHEHRMIMHQNNQRIVSQTGLRANALSHITLTFEHRNNNTLKFIDGKHIDLNAYDENIDILHLLKASYQQCATFINTPIGYSSERLLIQDGLNARIKPHAMVQLIHDVQKELTGAELSVTSLANTVTGCPQDITMSCILNTYVFANTLLLVELSGKTLKLALEENAQRLIKTQGIIDFHPNLYEPKKALYLFDMFDGIHYEITVKEHSKNILEKVTYNDVSIKDNDKFTLVMNSYMYATASNDSWIRETTIMNEFPDDVSEAIIEYVKTHRPLILKKTMSYIIK